MKIFSSRETIFQGEFLWEFLFGPSVHSEVKAEPAWLYRSSLHSGLQGFIFVTERAVKKNIWMMVQMNIPKGNSMVWINIPKGNSISFPSIYALWTSRKKCSIYPLMNKKCSYILHLLTFQHLHTLQSVCKSPICLHIKKKNPPPFLYNFFQSFLGSGCI